MKKTILLLSTAFLTRLAFAQNLPENEIPEMETDRPGQTQSPKLVPKNTFQLENGFYFEHDKSGGIIENEYRYPETTVRIGLFKFAELRLFGELKKSETKAELPVKTTLQKSGVARTSIGTKIHFSENKKLLPEAALLAMVRLPFGTKNFNAVNPEPDLRLAFTNELTDNLTLAYNIGMEWESTAAEEETETDRTYNHKAIYTLSLQEKISDKVSGFIEVFGEKQEQSRFKHSSDAGFDWKILPNFQIDALAGFGLTEAAPNFFTEAGISFRLPR